MEQWGFEYVTNMVWVKDRFGAGSYFRGQHEVLLLGKRGNMLTPLEADRPSSVLQAPRTEHSSKPKEVYELIRRMYPQGKYLELFARSTYPGWASWGNQLTPQIS